MQGLHPDRAHDRRRHHRHPGRGRDPGVHEVHPPLEDGRSDDERAQAVRLVGLLLRGRARRHDRQHPRQAVPELGRPVARRANACCGQHRRQVQAGPTNFDAPAAGRRSTSPSTIRSTTGTSTSRPAPTPAPTSRRTPTATSTATRIYSTFQRSGSVMTRPLGLGRLGSVLQERHRITLVAWLSRTPAVARPRRAFCFCWSALRRSRRTPRARRRARRASPPRRTSSICRARRRCSALSLGHHELAADLVFIRALVYFGAQLDAEGRVSLARQLPRHHRRARSRTGRRPYRWAGVATMYNGRAITNESGDAVEPLPRAGRRAVPRRLGAAVHARLQLPVRAARPTIPQQRDELAAQRRRVDPPRRHRRRRAVVGAAARRDHHARRRATTRPRCATSRRSTSRRRTSRPAPRCATASCRCTPRSTSRARSASARPSRRRGRRRCPTRRPICSSPSGAPRPPRMDVTALSPLGRVSDERAPAN